MAKATKSLAVKPAPPQLLPAEEVPASEPAAGQVINITYIDRELKKYDPIEAGLANLREKYGSITIAGVEDAAGIASAKAAISELTKVRTATEAKRKELKADSLEFGRRIDAKAKEITASVLELENPLRQRIDEIEAEKERLKRAEETRRVGILKDAGFELLGQRYAVGNVGNYYDTIMAMPLKEFNEFATAGAFEADRLKAEREKAQAEAAELEAKRKELAELEAKMAAMKAELAAATPPVPFHKTPGFAAGAQAAEDDKVGKGAYSQQPKAVDIWEQHEPTRTAGPLPVTSTGGHAAPAPLPMGAYGTYADGVMGTNYGGGNPSGAKMAPEAAQASASKQVWFNDGWEACKNRIIKIFTEDQTPRKRAEWVEIFRNLKP